MLSLVSLVAFLFVNGFQFGQVVFSINRIVHGGWSRINQLADGLLKRFGCIFRVNFIRRKVTNSAQSSDQLLKGEPPLKGSPPMRMRTRKQMLNQNDIAVERG